MKYKDIPYTDLKSTDKRELFKCKSLDDLLLNVIYRNNRNLFYADDFLRTSRENNNNNNDTGSFEEALERVKVKAILPDELGFNIKKLLKKSNIKTQEAPGNMIGLDIPSFLGNQECFVNLSNKIKSAKMITEGTVLQYQYTMNFNGVLEEVCLLEAAYYGVEAIRIKRTNGMLYDITRDDYERDTDLSIYCTGNWWEK